MKATLTDGLGNLARAGRVTANRQAVCVVGALPPPVHGMALVNAAIVERFYRSCRPVVTINLSAGQLRYGLGHRIRKVLVASKYLGQFIQLCANRQLGHVYICLSGGYGQVVELGFIILARLYRLKCICHHHSYAYLDRRFWVTSMLVKMLGSKAVHVVLSQGMAETFLSQYRGAGVALVVSNAAFLDLVTTTREQGQRCLRTLGFISNICIEKGIDLFLNLAEALSIRHPHLRFLIAGPFMSSVDERLTLEAVKRNPALTYLGPQYGEGKDAFFAAIEVLVFPTKYANEAEPLVVLEALARGIPIVAYGRGCIPELIDDSVGLLVHPSCDFITDSRDFLDVVISDPHRLGVLSLNASRRFAELKRVSEDAASSLLSRLDD